LSRNHFRLSFPVAGLFACLFFFGCKETTCEKLISISETCYSRYCVAEGVGDPLCICWEHDMVLGGWTAGSCTDGVDNNGTGLIDCEDPGCWDSEACNCDDGVDNDGDALTDCEDPDCARSVHCCHLAERSEQCCFDGIDHDDDGLTDCEEDSDCATAGDCCADGVDNDGDGLTDCEDPACAAHPSCCVDDTIEACKCDDGVDNNGNSLTDCEDPECFGHSNCWDATNSWNSERIPFCVEKERVLDQACHREVADDLIEAFDCEEWILLHRSGLPGKWAVESWTMRVDLRSDGVINEEESLPAPLIEGQSEAGNVTPLEKMTFYNDGWFDSNVSRGVWSLRLSRGKPTGRVSLYFLSDACLSNLNNCDTSKPTSWRKDAQNKIMFYEYLMVPESSRYILSNEPDELDYDEDGINDRVFNSLVLERL